MNRETISKAMWGSKDANLLRTGPTSEDWKVGNKFIKIGNNGLGIRHKTKPVRTLHFIYKEPIRVLRLL